MESNVLGNRYELIEKIGGGGMALVYKARCRLLNRFVAVKILREEFTGDEEFVKRFEIEAQSAASLSHPNIVPIYDVGNENNIFYIVMEYIDGITLKEYIVRNGPLDWKDAVRIAIQICSAIEHAHSKQIIHRDIKPQNILMTQDGIAKVTDFGIARAVTSSTITMVGSTIGSVHYFSPEQARGGYIDEKSDLYSLGIIMYEMITGKMPFDGESPVAIALKHIQDKPIQPIDLNKDIPRALNDIIMKAIKKEQSGRYQTATEMSEDLYRVFKEPNGDFAEDNGTDENPERYLPYINNPVLHRISNR
jgi:serine/threonine protein kinase